MHFGLPLGILFDALPPEIRAMIFATCIASPSPRPVRGCYSSPAQRLCDTPFTLSHVCKSWRDLALSTPQMWSHFALEVIHAPGTRQSSVCSTELEALQTWLSRSQGYPIDVIIVTTSSHLPHSKGDPSSSYNPTSRVEPCQAGEVVPPSDCSIQPLETLIGALRPHLQHIKSLQSSLSLNDVLGLVNDSKPAGSRHSDSPLFELRNFHLDLHLISTTIVSDQGINFSLPPNSDTTFFVSNLHIPWHRLTSLYLCLDYGHLLTLGECHEILAKCSNLEACTLSVDCTIKSTGDPASFLAHSADISDSFSAESLTLAPLLNLASLKQLRLILQGKAQPVAFHIAMEGGDGNATMVSKHPPTATLPSFLHFLESLSSTNLASLELEWLVQESNGEIAMSGALGANGWRPGHHQGQRFIQFLAAMANTLKNLKISYFPLSEAELLEGLRHLRGVENISFKYSLGEDRITDNFFKQASVQPRERRRIEVDLEAQPVAESTHNGLLLPSLRRLYIQTSGDGCFTPGLIDFVRMRWDNIGKDPTARLQSFHFSSTKTVTGELAWHIERWMDEGLDIAFETIRLY